MTYKVIMQREAYDDMFGHHDSQYEEFEIPFESRELVWYCYKKGRKFVVRESRIIGIWATNCVGVTLDNDWHILSDYFDRLFKNENDAIDWCLKQNQRGKVKVYRKW